ncbi:glycosyltransferase family 1 protein [Candidatus Parcubacteria bacterium]|nr:MAG: glycosyltransferase family 1 protein [Candidatus Parcubacteria bacterium]
MVPHIIIATGVYPPEIGGPATFTIFFEEELRKRGIPYTTIPFSGVRFLPKGIRHIAYFLRVLRAIRGRSIVLALDPVSVGFPAVLAAWIRGTPFYLRAGGDYAWEQATSRWNFQGLPEEFPGDFKLPLSGKLLVWAERFVARRAKRILTQSGHLASIVERWGVSRDTISVIPNSIVLPELPTHEEARKQYNFGDERVVVSAGRFVPWKGMSAVMNASKEISHIRLVLAGDGPERHALEAQANVQTQFVGALSREKLFTLLRAADVFVLNTRYEGFSHQILEAMAIGIPIITTDIPGNRELAEEGKTALIVPWNDEKRIAEAIRRLLTDAGLARTVAEGAQARAKEFTPERTFTETVKALGISLN